MRIVLADDQVEVRSALRVLLEHHPGLQVVGEAMDSEGLGQQLAATQPDLLLLDWEMLGVQASGALSDLQACYPHLRVIVMSGHPEVRRVALAAGANAFVSKGDPPEQLLAALKTATLTVAATPMPAATEANQRVVTPDFEGIIFARDSAAYLGLEPFLGKNITGFWTPNRADILALEERLGPYLRQAAPQSYPGPLKELREYKRQYMGILVNDQRVIFANFFCRTNDIDWQRDFVLVMDGGACFFEVKYNLQTQTIYDLFIHGES